MFWRTAWKIILLSPLPECAVNGDGIVAPELVVLTGCSLCQPKHAARLLQSSYAISVMFPECSVGWSPYFGYLSPSRETTRNLVSPCQVAPWSMDAGPGIVRQPSVKLVNYM